MSELSKNEISPAQHLPAEEECQELNEQLLDEVTGGGLSLSRGLKYAKKGFQETNMGSQPFTRLANKTVMGGVGLIVGTLGK